MIGKKLNYLLAFLLILTFNINAMGRDDKPANHRIDSALAKENCLVALKSDNEGLVESAIDVLIMVKKTYPTMDFEAADKELDRLSIEGETPSIRYKAQLASLYFQYPGLFTGINDKIGNSIAENYKLISSRLAEKVLTYGK